MVLHGDKFLRQAAEAKQRVPQLEPTELAALRSTKAILIDVRDPEEVTASSLASAMNIPIASIAERIVDTVPDRTAPIVCFCTGGNRGALAAAQLLDLGYTNVSSIAGGLRAVEALETLNPNEQQD